MPMHPLPALINHGVPVSLCSDDPAVFGNMGLSFDFFQVLVASEVSGLITMKELARQSFKVRLLYFRTNGYGLKEYIAFVVG